MNPIKNLIGNLCQICKTNESFIQINNKFGWFDPYIICAYCLEGDLLRQKKTADYIGYPDDEYFKEMFDLINKEKIRLEEIKNEQIR